MRSGGVPNSVVSMAAPYRHIPVCIERLLSVVKESVSTCNFISVTVSKVPTADVHIGCSLIYPD